MPNRTELDRRQFIQATLGAVAGLFVNRGEITASPHLKEASHPLIPQLKQALTILSPNSDLAEDPWHEARRPAQIPPPGEWRTWLLMAGRGFGKTRTAAEFIREEVMARRMRKVALVGATAADVRDVMVEGESGILRVCERYKFGAKYEPSRRRITFANGAVAHTYSAEEPNRLRGPEHDGFWADEVAAWEEPDAWDQLQFGLRVGQNPRGVAGTTPRPVRVILDLLAQRAIHYDEAGNAVRTDDPLLASVVVTSGTTYENRDNLAPQFLSQVIRRYEGTRLGRQEILGEVLLDIIGALWSHGLIDEYRLPFAPMEWDTERIVVGVDPMVGKPQKKKKDTDEISETGIVVAALAPEIDFTTRVIPHQADDQLHGYILEDASISGTPLEWARQVVEVFHTWNADLIVAEANNGGLMVEQTIRQVWPGAPIKLVHASKGKLTRAEPVSAAYEKGWVHHIGEYPELEKQMTEFDGTGTSPDRMDALVWALTELIVGGEEAVLDNSTLQHFAWKAKHRR
jgi:phage terminase large subunit-like protein